MAPSPIETLIDLVSLRCTRCGVSRERGCNCWEKVMLRCPVCSRAKRVTRQPSDPADAKVIYLRCPKCWDEASPIYRAEEYPL